MSCNCCKIASKNCHEVDGDQPRWLDDIEETDLLFGADRASALTTYIASFYFCSYTMTSVGYGDLGPKNIVERMICTFMVMSSGLCWAYVLGEVCAIVADFNAESQIFRKKMHHLNRTKPAMHTPICALILAAIDQVQLLVSTAG